MSPPKQHDKVKVINIIHRAFVCFTLKKQLKPSDSKTVCAGKEAQWSWTHTYCTCMHAYIIESEKIRILNRLQIEVNQICQVKPQSSLRTSELTLQSAVSYKKYECLTVYWTRSWWFGYLFQWPQLVVVVLCGVGTSSFVLMKTGKLMSL